MRAGRAVDQCRGDSGKRADTQHPPASPYPSEHDQRDREHRAQEESPILLEMEGHVFDQVDGTVDGLVLADLRIVVALEFDVAMLDGRGSGPCQCQTVNGPINLIEY